MSPIGPLHIAIVNRLNRLLSRQVGDAAIVSVQNAIQLDDYSEPQPDIVLLAPRADFYADALTRPDDVLLLVEVADSSLAYDRDEKLPRYAAAGIPVVWIIDVAGRCVEQHANPRGSHYRTREIASEGSLQLAAIAAMQIDLAQIFG